MYHAWTFIPRQITLASIWIRLTSIQINTRAYKISHYIWLDLGQIWYPWIGFSILLTMLIIDTMHNMPINTGPTPVCSYLPQNYALTSPHGLSAYVSKWLGQVTSWAWWWRPRSFHHHQWPLFSIECPSFHNSVVETIAVLLTKKPWRATTTFMCCDRDRDKVCHEHSNSIEVNNTYPVKSCIFFRLSLCKVVILGPDKYHSTSLVHW